MSTRFSASMPWGAFGVLVCLLFAAVRSVPAQNSTPPMKPGEALVVVVEGSVQVMRRGATVWDDLTSTNKVLYPGDQLRTGERSRATILLTPLNPCRVGQLSQLQIPIEASKRSGLNFFRGLLY